jgi:hypothetical protein
VSIVKHLEDEDDLNFGRDTILIPEQYERAKKLADDIYKTALEGDYKILAFFISPKLRAQGTADLVSHAIHELPDSPRILRNTETELREIDQGSFVLPKDYKPGDKYDGLKIAGKIFSSETFKKNPGEDNLDYHYGDPLPGVDGTFVYPELANYFTKSGESYREILIRFYGEALKLSKHTKRFADAKVLPVIFTHGQPHQIFSDLSLVAGMVKEEGFVLELGKLPRLCWDIYNSRRKDIVPYGTLLQVSAEYLNDPKMVELLQREFDYLVNNMPESTQ